MAGSVERLATTFDAQEAATVIRRMEGYEAGLHRRTEGITWMIWALVFAGITMSYWVMGLLTPPGTEDAGGLPDGGLVIPWIGWVLAGGLATAAVWRGAALRGASGLRHVAALGAIMALMWILFIASWFVPAALTQHLFAVGPLVLFGIATLIVVSTGLMPLSAEGRTVGRVVALAQIGGGLLFGLAVAWGRASLPVAPELAATLFLGGAWMAAGLWQSTRG